MYGVLGNGRAGIFGENHSILQGRCHFSITNKEGQGRREERFQGHCRT